MIHVTIKDEDFDAYTLSDCAIKMGVMPREIGHHKPPVGHIYGPAVRDGYLIHVAVSGKGWFSRNGKTYKLGAGDCFIIRPMESTTYGVDNDMPWEYYWVAFYGDEAKTLADFALGDEVCTVKVSAAAEGLIRSLYKNVSGGESDVLNITSGLYAFLAELGKCIMPEKAPASDVIEKAIKYMENNYHRKINIASLAGELGITRSHFTGVFTQRTGMSPYRYIMQLRMEKAKQLLRNEELTVSEVAYSVGFSGPERFSEMFKKHFGDSPLAFRRKIYGIKCDNGEK